MARAGGIVGRASDGPLVYVQGFNSDFNEALKSETLRVTSVSSCAWAVAAMSASSYWMR